MTLASQKTSQQQSVWIFGYGSLIWRTDFDFMLQQPAYIKGWGRKFWQGSTDHRGTPTAPGRVLTLEKTQGICCGMAYKLPMESQNTILQSLDYREKDGYKRLELDLYFFDQVAPVFNQIVPDSRNTDQRQKNSQKHNQNTEKIDSSSAQSIPQQAPNPANRAVTYIADVDNPHYLGPATNLQIAHQIVNAAGASGSNADYILKLQAALAKLTTLYPAYSDPYIDDISAIVKQLSDL
ncbi:MAG: gamma-glutamylcyclotransferase [Pseudomonadales bacterium]|nr:gamma-glutamylcyclotransferase [Pseudomonadales bacterium]